LPGHDRGLSVAAHNVTTLVKPARSIALRAHLYRQHRGNWCKIRAVFAFHLELPC